MSTRFCGGGGFRHRRAGSPQRSCSSAMSLFYSVSPQFQPYSVSVCHFVLWCCSAMLPLLRLQCEGVVSFSLFLQPSALLLLGFLFAHERLSLSLTQGLRVSLRSSSRRGERSALPASFVEHGYVRRHTLFSCVVQRACHAHRFLSQSAGGECWCWQERTTEGAWCSTRRDFVCKKRGEGEINAPTLKKQLERWNPE